MKKKVFLGLVVSLTLVLAGAFTAAAAEVHLWGSTTCQKPASSKRPSKTGSGTGSAGVSPKETMESPTIAIMRYWVRMARSALTEVTRSRPAQATIETVSEEWVGKTPTQASVKPMIYRAADRVWAI